MCNSPIIDHGYKLSMVAGSGFLFHSVIRYFQLPSYFHTISIISVFFPTSILFPWYFHPIFTVPKQLVTFSAMAVADCEDCLALTTFRGRQARGDHNNPS